MVSLSTSPRSHHTSDPLLQPFLSPTYDPTTYLNSVLPALSLTPSKSANTLPLSDLTAQTQSHIAQLSAQTARLTTTLTSLTDDILRSGSRLAYEVEVLRGEAVSLSETLSDTLVDDIEKFVPEGLELSSEANGNTPLPPTLSASEPADSAPTTTDSDPLTRLRTLHQVRTSLQHVKTTFDTALQWPLPPSLIQSSSLIAVTSPSPAQEAAGQEALSKLRQEIIDLLNSGEAEEGVLKAEQRVEELRELVGVWKGTAEEKARRGIVEGLGKIVAEKRREIEMRGSLQGREGRQSGEVERPKGGGEGKGKGFLSGLSRLREEIYLD
jgi:hypothetical protein